MGIPSQLYLKKWWQPPSGHLDQHYNGVGYDSGFECWCAQQLDLMVLGHEYKKVERQVRKECRMHGVLVTTYKWDFVLTANDGHLVFIECKGYFHEKDKPRFKLATIQAHQENMDCEVWLVMQGKSTWTKKLLRERGIKFKAQGIVRVKRKV